jgi:type I restriction enzyme, R subunit
VLKVTPLSEFGNPSEIARRFGGSTEMRRAVDTMAGLIYAK